MIQKLQDSRAVLLGAVAIFAIGLTTSGYVLGDGLRRAKMAEPTVTVRGVSERNVTADLATWSVDFSQQGADLAPVQESVDSQARNARAFFQRSGFRPDEIADSNVSVSRERPRGEEKGPERLTVRRSIQLRTNDVMKARAAYARQAELLRDGVELLGSSISYTFTSLNALKPQMIAEANQNARRSAEEFARDSGASVGRIKTASQGSFFRSAPAMARNATTAARRAEARPFKRCALSPRSITIWADRPGRSLRRWSIGLHRRSDAQHLDGLGGSLADRAVGIAARGASPVTAG